jgi:hypothetical protein
MEYTCQHCSANLDEGDILEHFVIKYGSSLGVLDKARDTARLYGWTETNKLHFLRTILIQPKKGSQYIICPDCKKQDPLPTKTK